MKIYAHRGASHDFPEMTMVAYENAVKQGADGFECDLRLTKDGVAVLWHDADLKRRANNAAVVHESTYAQLVAIYPQIVTLDQFIDFGITEKKSLLLETKHPVPSRTEIENHVVQKLHKEAKRIEKAGIDITVMSFSWFAVERVKQLDKSIALTYLIRETTPRLSVRYSSAHSIGPGIAQLRKKPALAQQIKSAGKKLNVWTVDEPSDIILCRHLGVDNLITNRPAFAREVLAAN
ncbi:glycerophosphodiester phosphodiesterase [Candidatus Planktophila lacus]|jgi:glycerophosphoryl diester phosphodiesterase|uniref:Glycerophosphoryl diester phosphodiesterase n=1 Tax=Candidatus Planktophila lacus TaxID=1884913 RepID=A0AAC9YSM8_9ACTN|nr:glycerophosphodiester phosphodiesterase family protein [Candidatus Planktophila lacus]ASY11247.1 glycerophosphoryl diester phosphodiesterase [Candidatus Planktophila lacus]